MTSRTKSVTFSELPDRELSSRAGAAAVSAQIESFDSPAYRYFRNRLRVIKYGDVVADCLTQPKKAAAMRDSGWTGERRAARASDEQLGGSHAHNYGKFVKKMFNTKPDKEQIAAYADCKSDATDLLDDPYNSEEITAKHVIQMAKMEKAVDQANRAENEYDRPSEPEREIDIDSLLNPKLAKKPPLVYQTKSSAEYMNLYCRSGGKLPSGPRHHFDYKVQEDRGNKTSYAVDSEKDYLKSPHDLRAGSTVLVDYSRLPSTDRRLSTNYHYKDTSFLRRTDSRIVGSDFVVVSMHRDPWYDKVDRLLADVRSSSRF